MFTLGISIAIYAYGIWFLGIAGLLYKSVIIVYTLVFVSILLLFINKQQFLHNILDIIYWIKKRTLFQKALLFLLIIQTIVNLIGALGPELAFDALWYHLTFPKLYLQSHQITHFQGGLLYYSTLPKLTEMLYVTALSLGNEVLAKLIHFMFGLLTCIGIYKLARKYITITYSILAIVVFYSNLVVGWMSITAYIDLARTFYELLAIWSLILFSEQKDRRYVFLSAIFFGIAISTKLISLGSLILFLVLLMYILKNSNFITKIKYIGQYFFISILIPLPWFIFSIIHTKNPIYPIFSGYPIEGNLIHLFNPFTFIKDIFLIFTHSADPISPIYLIMIPLMIMSIKYYKKNEKIILLYSLLALITWYFTPQTGGGRYMLPFLPVISILVVLTIVKIREYWLKNYLICICIILLLVSITYRTVANKKYIPVIMGQQSKTEFLTKNLNFNFGDYYDTDSYLTKTIKSSDKVLIYGIHNLFYVDFPFIHESYKKPNDTFNYILVGNNDSLTSKYNNWKIIYQNNINKTKLYRIN